MHVKATKSQIQNSTNHFPRVYAKWQSELTALTNPRHARQVFAFSYDLCEPKTNESSKFDFSVYG